MSIILLLDGFKTEGEGAHKALIGYMQKNYSQLSEYDISVIDEMRTVRNRIAYDGFFVTNDYLMRRLKPINTIIRKLMSIVKGRM